MNAKKAIAAILETALRIIILLMIISFVYKTGGKAYDFGYRVFAERPMTMGVGRDVIVTIPEGKGSRQIGSILVDRGLIRDANLFFVQELLSAYHGKLKSGTYTLNTAMNSTEMMEIMSGGETASDEDEDGDVNAPVTEPDISEDEPFVEDPLEETSGEAEPEGDSEDIQQDEESEESGEQTEGEDKKKKQTEGEEIVPADVTINVEGQN